MIFTFYSYKGGVGRSLTLACLAYLFAERGLNVLALDFDLEAPGLERYFFGGVDANDRRKQSGLIDLIQSYRKALSDESEFARASFRNWKSYCHPVRDPVNAKGGRLDLMTAGQRSPEEALRQYAQTVRNFDWQDFFFNWKGDRFFEWLQRQFDDPGSGYDVVLVDSRTGVTEMGGVCAYQLADAIVLLCAPNYQNLDGTRAAMRDFLSPSVLAIRRGRPLQLLAIPARLEPDHPKREQFLVDFERELGSEGMPACLAQPQLGLDYRSLALPYETEYSVSERLVGANALDLGGPLSRLADALTLLAPEGSRLGKQKAMAERRLRQQGSTTDPATELQADSSLGSAGFDVVIDCGARDKDRAQALRRLCEREGLRCADVAEAVATGASWSDGAELLVRYCDAVLVCFGRNSDTPWRLALIQRARARDRVQIVVVLLPGADPAALHAFGLESAQQVDLQQMNRAGHAALAMAPLFERLRRHSARGSEPDVGGETAERRAYVGCRPYGEDDQPVYFGREADLAALLDAVCKRSLVLIEGPAGVGKTSLLMAGLVPALRNDPARAQATVRTFDMRDERPDFAWLDHDEVVVLDHIDSPSALVHLQRLIEWIGKRPAHSRVVVCGRGSLDTERRKRFEAVLRKHDVGRVFLNPLDDEAARQAIEAPALKEGYLVEPGVTRRVLEMVGQTYSNTALIQLAMTRLWDDRRRGWLTNASLDRLTSLSGGFAAFAWRQAAVGSGIERNGMIRALILRLLQLDGERRPVAAALALTRLSRTPTLRAATVHAALDALAERGLIDMWCGPAAAGNPSACQVRLALAAGAVGAFGLSQYDLDFVSWRDGLEAAFETWDQSGRSDDSLIAGERLTVAEAWRRQMAVHLSDEAAALVDASIRARAGRMLRVTVWNGNLRFIGHPLMVGHTRSLALTGTEAVVDSLVGGAMAASLDAGLYPDAPGTQQIFINSTCDPSNPWRIPRPQGVIVVGLGPEGRLSEAALIASVSQGVLAWAQRMAETSDRSSAPIELAATLMGSGGIGMNASTAARAIAQGVRDANQHLQQRGWPLVSELVLVELYMDRASRAWTELQILAESAPGDYEVTAAIGSGAGRLRSQLDSGYRGTDHDLLVATSPAEGMIAFGLDTIRTPGEVRSQSWPGGLLRDMVARASAATGRDPRLGRTLFQLLVPPEIEPFLAGTNRLLLELDDRTATIPWELLDTGNDDGARSDKRPWAIRTQLLRKLRQERFRQPVQEPSSDDAVLVIGEPQADNPPYAALPGARAEALAVVAALQGPGGIGAERVTALIDSNDAASVINALFERRYRIVHVAAHGEPVQKDPLTGRLLSKGGVVLSDGSFLGSDEINSMRTVPELVFVNCCHLAARDTSATLAHGAAGTPGAPADVAGAPGGADRAFNRAEFAWGLADSLLEIGVRCVVAAGWAVDDRPAVVFATTFYRELLARRPFINAVAAAREAAWREDPSGNTWAAYQAYGDPNWVYRGGTEGSDQSASPPLAPSQEFEGVASPPGLTLALEEIAVQSTWMKAGVERQLPKVRHLEARFAGLWGGIGAVAEAFGQAYAEAGDRGAAIAWYERALAAADGSAQIKALEQLSNLRARVAWDSVEAPGATAATQAQARRDIQRALADLQALARLSPTLERASLLGSAHKRLGLLEGWLGNAAASATAFAAAAAAYAEAEALAHAAGGDEAFYPALNRMALELVTRGKGWPGFTPEASAAVRRALQAKAERSPDFWCFAGQIELDLLQAVADGRLADAAPALQAAYAELHGRVAARSFWGSVADQAVLVLEPYAAGARGAERAAAQALLAALQGHAG